MIAMLLWIVGCYGLAVAVVHLVYRFQNKLRGEKPAPWIHVVIVSHNDERHMEWIIRAYCWFAWLKGRRLKFTVVDQRSTDDTAAIISKLMHQHDELSDTEIIYVKSRREQEEVIRCLESTKASEETQLILRLHQQANWRRLPYVAGGAL